MAIIIFLRERLSCQQTSRLAVMISGVLLVFLTPALGAGYVISARDRARATELSQQAYLTYQSGDYARALSLLGQSDQLRPDQPDGWNLRGVVLLKQKAYDQAQTAFARAAALDPNLWAARFNLAEVLFQRKDYARARARFERLLSQTDRYKEANKWELVQYKALVSSVLLGDTRAAEKKLAKLPAANGATPAFLYAQAALAFGRKNPAQAQKSLAAAQTAFPEAINDLFSGSLVQAGWQTPPPLPLPLATLASNLPPSSPAASSPDLRAAYVIDPRLQAASAGPLPVADAPTRPVVPPITPALRHAPAAVAVETKPALRVETGSDLENGGLLLDSGL